MKFIAELKRRNVLRVAAAYLAFCWLLVQMMETLFPIFELSETLLQPLIIVLGVGLAPVLILSWIYELTPDGVKLDAEVDRSTAAAEVSRTRLDTAIMSLLVLAVGYFAFDKFVLDPTRDAEEVRSARQEVVDEIRTAEIDKSIAVLPFVDLSPDNDQEYFSDGLSEELLNLLAKIPELRVAARTSSFAFKGKNQNVSEIGEALRVGHVLEGSVRMSGDRVRVTAQLIKAEDGYHLWSETYDRSMDDIFAVQDEISAKVVDVLKLTLLSERPRSFETVPEAFEKFLQAKYMQQQFTTDSMQNAEQLYRETLELDPGYVPAMTDLCSVYLNQAQSGGRDPDDATRLARELALNAIRIDPNFAPAYNQLGWITHVYDDDLSAAADYYEKALSLQPTNPSIAGNAAVLAEALGRLDEAIALKKFLADRAATSAIAHNNLGLAYFYANRLIEAESSMRTTVALSPEYIGAQYRLATVMLLRGKAEQALETYELEVDDEYRVKGRALAMFALDRTEESDAALTELTEGWGDQWPTEIAHVHAYRGEIDEAFQWLDRRAAQGGSSWGEQRLNRLFDNLHDDPRWEPFLEKMNVSADQLSQIEFSVTIPEQT